MKPLVSILVPAFNAQEWIAETLCSALAQTWPRKEIVVVDDGSTDRTLAIAQQFESKGVRVVSQSNQGPSAARNKAFSLSHGDYIQWLDADDLLAPDKIARQMEEVEKCRSKRTLFSSAWGRFLYRYYRAKFIPNALWRDLSPTEWLLIKLGQHLYMLNSTWLVSRELTVAAGPWDTRLAVDNDGEYFCRVLLQCDGIRFVPEAKVYYRSPGSKNVSYVGYSRRKIESRFRSVQLHINYLRSLEDSERVRAACVRYLQTYLIYFYPENPHIVNRADQLARELGGRLEIPRLRWKYSWIKPLFGWKLAKLAQLFLPRVRWALERFWDKSLFRLEVRGRAVDLPN